MVRSSFLKYCFAIFCSKNAKKDGIKLKNSTKIDLNSF